MTRNEIVELLPFYVNGTLEAEERTTVEAALAEDAELRTELDLLTSLRDHMQAEEVNSPGEVGLSQLMAKLDSQTPANLSRPPRIWQIAAAVLLAVTIIQGLLLVAPGDDAATYQLVDGTEAAITVSFLPGVTEADLRASLLAAGLEIVAGPSALGLYGLAPLEGVDVDEAQAALRETGIVESLQ